MDRTTITLDVETRTRLRRIAADRGVSMAALIREAIDATIEQHAPRPRSLGIGASGTTDTARRAGDERPEPRTWR
ncbi:MAG: 1 protein [Chloroflexota bacterium]|jgi:post-segregation antitoxin (ccd killing protein)|nr:1 protein [Chloroflexota bacterium]